MLRVVFMGTPDFAVPSLQALLNWEDIQVAGVFCQPDRPKGRGNRVEMCPVKKLALEHGIPVFQPQRIRKDGAEDLNGLHPDLCVTAAFGQILSEENLAAPRMGTVNVHASLLPKYRGSAPVNWALINGEKETGVTTMLTDKGLDTGDMLLKKAVPIPDEIDAGELTALLSQVGAELLIRTIQGLLDGTCRPQPQREEDSTYFPMLKKETGHIDFARPAREIVDLVRGVSPWPGAYALAGEETLKVWKARAAEGQKDAIPGTVLRADPQGGLLIQAGDDTALQVLEMQMPGGKRMRAEDYLRGHGAAWEKLV